MSAPESHAANEYGPTPEELEERILSILRRYPVKPDDAREVGGAVETLVEYANRSLTDACATDHEAEPVELSREDFVALLTERIANTLGLTLDEFATMLANGEIDPELPQVAGLAMFVRAFRP